jgi:hypothetical protein
VGVNLFRVEIGGTGVGLVRMLGIVCGGVRARQFVVRLRPPRHRLHPVAVLENGFLRHALGHVGIAIRDMFAGNHLRIA